MDWQSFVAGLLIGWLIEFAIDWFYWRRRTNGDVATAGAEVEGYRSRLATAEARIQELEAELNTARQAGAGLATAQDDLAALRHEVDTGRTEVEQLRIRVAELQPCADDLTAAQEEIGRLRQQLAQYEPSDLKLIEGIGPKIEEILNAAGIFTFHQLGTTGMERLQTILDAAGERYRLADPESWPEQARLAAAERWDELSQLQERLKGGRDAHPAQGGAEPV